MNPSVNCEFILQRVNIPDTIVLDKPEHTYTCGRGKENQIVCLSLTVSRNHCIFFRRHDELYVTDLRSSNGLYINGVAQRPFEMIRLAENDVIGIGCADINSREHNMFAYRLGIIRPRVPEKEVKPKRQKTAATASTSKGCTSEDDRENVPNRKRGSRKSDAVVPNKIQRLENKKCHSKSNKDKVVKEKALEKPSTCKLKSEEDIEIVHVSLKNDISEQSMNDPINCAAENTENKDKLNLSEHIIDTSSDKSHGGKNNNDTSLSDNSKVKEDVSSNRDDSFKSPLLNGTENIIKRRKNSKTACNEVGVLHQEANSKEKSSSISEKDTPLQNQTSSIEKRKRITNTLIAETSGCNSKTRTKGKNNDTETKINKQKTKTYQDEVQNSNLNHDNSNELSSSHSHQVVDCTITDNSKSKNCASPDFNPNIICNGDVVIKLEAELQLTDNDEESILKSQSNNSLPAISPLKLKKVKQEPKTRFSEIDVVNISDDEDDIFPCSQLFDAGFGVDSPIKKEVKQELPDTESVGFSRLDDPDTVISLSDSEDEDNTWLQRLSRSQILNESDDMHNETDKVKKEDVDIKIVDTTEKIDVSRKASIDSASPTAHYENSENDNKNKTTDLTFVHTEAICDENVNVGVVQDSAMDIVTNSSDSSHEGRLEITNFEDQILPGSEQKSKENLSTNSLQENAKESSMDTTKDSIEPPISLGKRNIPLKKVPEIEPPHLPTRRRSSIHNIKINESSFKPAVKNKKELREKDKIEQHLYKKEQKNRKVIHKWADCLPLGKKKSTTLTKEQKKILADDRKEKLKKLALEEKRTSLDGKEQTKRIVTKPKAKVSMRTRADFLINEQISFNSSKSSLEDSMEKSKTSINQSFKDGKDKSSTVDNNESVLQSNKIAQSKDISNEMINKVTRNLSHSLKLTHVPDKGKIPLTDNHINKDKTTDTSKEILTHSTLKINKIVDKLEKLSTTKDVVEKEKSITDSHIPIEKRGTIASNLKTMQNKGHKKRVSFATTIKTVREYEIDPQNKLKKFTGKDAPIPIEKLPTKMSNSVAESCPKLEEFLFRIFTWNPVWLEEQKFLNSIAPVVRDDEIHPMLTHYKSYGEYYRIVVPLLLLEIWCGITKEFDCIEKNSKRATVMCSIVENSIVKTPIPSKNLSLTTLMLEVLITKDDSHRQTHPNYGDLVFFEYVKTQGGKQVFHKVFAYVTNVYQTVLTPFTYYNKDLKNYVKNPYALLTYTMLAKPLEENLPVNRVQRLRAVTYLRANIRMVQALQHLPQSPLMPLILNPKIDVYQLPAINEPQTCSLVTKDKLNHKQLEAVLRVTEAVVQKTAKLCFIQGPPGTGKSKVIVNIVTQILYGGNRYGNGSFRILVCAPSNAAIDELVLRLLTIRSTIKHNRFKMVRIGRSEVMHPAVKDISLTELAKRDVKRTTSSYSSNNIPLDSVEEEKLFLEARINALKCELTTSQKVDEVCKKHIKMKLADMTAKYELLKNRVPFDKMNPKELAKLQRAAENKLLAGADIITCTLSSCYTNQMESIFGGNRERISVCIVDEATQSCEAETLIPLMLGVKTLILVGDPNQLPATVLSQQAKKMGLDQSIFSRVQNAFDGQSNNPIIMLDTQYRMAYAISYWPNKFFYGGKLKYAAEHSQKFPFHPYRILNLNTNQNIDKFSNTDEATFVANLILCLMTCSNLESWGSTISIGVLTPYNNQRSLVVAKIEEKTSSVPENIRKKIKIEVNTVDGFQGQERDVIIMSCVRSQGIGFMSDRQRLCVALTRAKYSLILCGTFNAFTRDQMWSALLSDARSRGVFCNVHASAQPSEIKVHVTKRPEAR